MKVRPVFDLCDTERSGFIAVSHLQDLCREQGKVCQYSLLSVSSGSDSAFCLLQDLCRERGKICQYSILCFLSPLSLILLSAFCMTYAGNMARSVNIFCFLSPLPLILLLPSAGPLQGTGQGLSIFSAFCLLCL